MNDDIIEKYIKAGKLAAKVLKEIHEFVSPKKRIDLLEIAEKAESLILKNGAKPAFPCNIGYNALAAHYTPVENEELIFEKGLLKIDVGVHLDGYIADTAYTLARGRDFQEIVKVNEDVLKMVIDLLKPGAKLGYLGGLIEEEVKRKGYKVIENLSGHLIDRYNLHAGKNFPNVKEYFSPSIKSGEVYAIEPFITFTEGAGKVISGNISTIYSLARTKKVKDKELDRLRRYILNNFGPLPFTYRWLENVFPRDYIAKLNELGVIKE